MVYEAVDPIITLASSMQAAKGTYALLVGSGISRSAQVPTGWEVVSELARRTAAAAGEDPTDDPIAWYAHRFGGDVDYSRILEDLAPTPAERRALLEQFFVPTDDERARGVKTPTKAHRAIARLATRGYVRVIVTTNFDRLLETALTEAGVDAEVISSAAVAAGATPLNHARVTIIKVHGDYMSPDIKNTVDELAGYETVIDELLDEILDRYGLVVCGWSAEWDQALRNAVDRARNRRYTTYWCHRGPLSPYAKQLVDNRVAQPIAITDADQFFEELETKVSLLAEMASSPPLSTALVIEELKRYLPDPVQRIRLADLVTTQARQTADAVGIENFPTPSGMVDRTQFEERLCLYELRTDRLIAMLATGVYFGDPDLHDELWQRSVLLVDSRTKGNAGSIAWIGLQEYPTMLAVFAIGLAGVVRGDVSALLRILLIRAGIAMNPERILDRASPPRAMGSGVQLIAHTPEGQRRFTPASDHVQQALREPLHFLFMSDDEYDQVFDTLEFLVAAMTASLCGWNYLGSFWWRRFRFTSAVSSRPSIERFRNQLVVPGIFETDDAFDTAVDRLTSFASSQPPI